MIFKCSNCGNILDEPLIRVCRHKYRISKGRHYRKRQMKTVKVRYLYHKRGETFSIICPICGHINQVKK